MEGAITARRLAHFLKSVEAEELLLTQRLRDAAIKRSLDVIESDFDLANTVGAIGQSCRHEAQDESPMSETTSESDWREFLPEY